MDGFELRAAIPADADAVADYHQSGQHLLPAGGQSPVAAHTRERAGAKPLDHNEHVSWRGARHLNHPGPRHSPEWYDQSDEPTVLAEGDRMFIACEGGPCQSRLEMFPPRLEVEETEGVYVLVDDGPREQWRYIFGSRTA